MRIYAVLVGTFIIAYRENGANLQDEPGITHARGETGSFYEHRV